MPPGELVGRAAGQWGIQRLKRIARTPDKWTHQVVGMEDVVAAACQTLLPGTRPKQRERLATEFPRESEALSRDSQRVASAIAAGEYQLLGQTIRVDRPIDWHADPVTGHRWNDAFFNRVSYHQIPEQVDFKHVWELGRHQYLVELTRSAALNRDDSHLALARQVLESWLSQNRFGHGIHWTSGLEVAMRGSGGHGFHDVYGTRYIKSVTHRPINIAKSVHQGFIKEACECGLQGPLLRMLLFTCGIIFAWRTSRLSIASQQHFVACTALAAIAGLVGLAVQSLFGSFLNHEWGIWLIAISIGCHRFVREYVPEPVSESSPTDARGAGARDDYIGEPPAPVAIR